MYWLSGVSLNEIWIGSPKLLYVVIKWLSEMVDKIGVSGV